MLIKYIKPESNHKETTIQSISEHILYDNYIQHKIVCVKVKKIVDMGRVFHIKRDLG